MENEREKKSQKKWKKTPYHHHHHHPYKQNPPPPTCLPDVVDLQGHGEQLVGFRGGLVVGPGGVPEMQRLVNLLPTLVDEREDWFTWPQVKLWNGGLDGYVAALKWGNGGFDEYLAAG